MYLDPLERIRVPGTDRTAGVVRIEYRDAIEGETEREEREKRFGLAGNPVAMVGKYTSALGSDGY